MATYLPSREAELVHWATDFSTKVTAAPESYGLTPAQSGEVSVAVDAFTAAYATATNRETRTPVTIEAKDDAKKAMLGVVRGSVRLIQAWPQITDAKRSALGITVPDPTPTRSPLPATSPQVIVRSVDGRLLELQLKEDGTDRRGKPEGVRSAWSPHSAGGRQPSLLR
jgi:hypothetical protein